MNLPFKIASQYLFTDRFFSREGLIINSISSLLILILMYFNIEWGVPFLIMQLLPFSFIKENTLYNWGVKLGLGLIMVLSPMVLLYGIIGLLIFKIIKEIQSHKRPKIASILLTLVVSALLFFSFWLGVMFYILSLFIQQLFIGKRNAVHVISRISVLGITVGTTALILVLSVFNGFEVLIIDLFDSFNPDIKITATKGKVFIPDSSQVAELHRLEEVDYVSETLEEVAFFEYEGSQDFGVVKGVDAAFEHVSNVDSNIIRGMYALRKGETNYAVLGMGMEYKLAVNVENRLNSLNIYMPKRKRTATLQNAFKKRFAYPIGTFAIQQEFDDQFILVDLEFARDLLSYKNEVSALELKLKPKANTEQAVQKIQAIMGEDFRVRDRYRQNEAFFKLMNMEKWIGFAVLSFTLLLVSFNMVGALWMLVLDKKKDIAILKSMGTVEKDIQQIFIYKGVLLALLGGLSGMYIALIFYFFQTQADLIRLSGSANLLVDTYPIGLKWLDFVLVFLTVVAIGVLASWLPAWRAKRINPLIREE
jgi:lipoprotein-releasing system permease protein